VQTIRDEETIAQFQLIMQLKELLRLVLFDFSLLFDCLSFFLPLERDAKSFPTIKGGGLFGPIRALKAIFINL
jgi:hypothetical protein